MSRIGWEQPLCEACYVAWKAGQGEAPSEPVRATDAQGKPCLFCDTLTLVRARIDPALAEHFKQRGPITIDETDLDESNDPRVVLLREHEKLLQMVMSVVDLIEHGYKIDRRLETKRMRRALGPQMRESVNLRDGALRELGLAIPADLYVVNNDDDQEDQP